jgi:hypothetical protein
MSKRFLTGLNLANLTSDPETGTEGDLYFNTTDKSIKIYIDDQWKNLPKNLSDLEDIDLQYLDNEHFLLYDSSASNWYTTSAIEYVGQEVDNLFTHENHVGVTAEYDNDNNEIILTVESQQGLSFIDGGYSADPLDYSFIADGGTSDSVYS